MLKLFPSVSFLGNHKLTATAKVIVKICEHEVCIVNDKNCKQKFFVPYQFFKCQLSFR